MEFVRFLFQCNTGQNFVMFERYQRAKFEVAEFMNFKWQYLGIYLKLGDK